MALHVQLLPPAALTGCVSCRSGAVRPFLLVSTRSSLVKVNAESLQVEETALSLDDDTATLRDVAAFTADVNLQTVYWLDAVSRNMWRTTLTSSHHSLVCYCY